MCSIKTILRPLVSFQSLVNDLLDKMVSAIKDYIENTFDFPILELFLSLKYLLNKQYRILLYNLFVIYDNWDYIIVHLKVNFFLVMRLDIKSFLPMTIKNYEL